LPMAVTVKLFMGTPLLCVARLDGIGPSRGKQSARSERKSKWN
jgi:hypothetical protein